MGKIFLCIFATTCLLLTSVTSQSGTDVDALITHLFTANNYNKKVRPLVNQSEPINISVDFVINETFPGFKQNVHELMDNIVGKKSLYSSDLIFTVIGFDEQEENLKTAGYLVLRWKDEYLIWDPMSHEGILELLLPQDDVWKPDISLRNTFKTFTGLGSTYLNVIISNNGSIEWNPFQVLESTCSVDITYFPFDSQTCIMKFTAWSYRSSEVTLEIGNLGVVLEDYIENSAWAVVKTSASYPTDGEVAVLFSIKLDRRPRFYIITVILPAILLSILSVFTFILPISSGEKASYAVTVFLSLSVFLTIIASELPKNSENTSHLAVYVILVSSWSTLSVILCLIEARIYIRDARETSVGTGFMVFVTIRHLLTCKKFKMSVKPNFGSEGSLRSIDTVNKHVTWENVVDGMDFVFFWVSLVFTFVCTLYIVIIAVG